MKAKDKNPAIDPVKLVELVDSGSPMELVAKHFGISEKRANKLYREALIACGRVVDGDKPEINLDRRFRRVQDIKRRIARGESQTAVARKYGVSRARINRIVKRPVSYRGSGSVKLGGRPMAEVKSYYLLWRVMVEFIRDRRTLLGWTAEEVCAKFHQRVTASFYLRWERGDKVVPPDRIKDAWRVLGIHASESLPKGYRPLPRIAHDLRITLDELLDVMGRIYTQRRKDIDERQEPGN